jgi:hypothetical protein
MSTFTYSEDELLDAHNLSRRQFASKWGSHHRWAKLRRFDPPPPREAIAVDSYDTPISDLWQTVKDHARAERDTDTDITSDTLDLSASKLPIGWFFDGDFHIGSKWTDYETLEDNLRYVGAWRARHPGALVLTHMGDAVDAFLAKHGAASGLYEEIVTRIDKQEELFLHTARWAGGWNYMHYGCHPAWTLTVAGRDPLTPLVNAINDEWRNHKLEHPNEEHAINGIGAKNAGYGIEVKLLLRDQVYYVLSRHRMRRESTVNTENAMRVMDDELGPAAQRADVIALGHMHTPELHIRQKSGRPVTYLRSGAYKGGDCYARAIGATAHKDSHPGPGLVIFRPDTHETIAFDWRAWRAGLELLGRMRNDP